MTEDIKILREALAAHAQWCEEDGEISDIFLFNKAKQSYRSACDPDRIRRILDDAERYQWQSIETAPKDPRARVLLRWVSGTSEWICIGAWDSVENSPGLKLKGCPREGWVPDGGVCIPMNQKDCVSFMPLPKDRKGIA